MCDLAAQQLAPAPVSFVQLSEPAETPYGSGEIGSKYQGQRGPTPSRYWKNYEAEVDARR